MNKDWKIGEILLLVSQLFERIAHYSITANLTLMLLSKPFNWKNYNAVAAPLLLNGFCFISSMVGGILSDIYFRKTTTVIIGYIFYLSYAGFPYLFWDLNLPRWCNANITSITNIVDEKCSSIVLPSIIFSAMGSGLIRSVVASIGADMAHNKWKNPSLFFNLYYWCLNCGSLIAFLGISTLQQQMDTRQSGYLVPSGILVMSFVTFLMGGPFYIHQKKPRRSTFSLVFHVYLQAIEKKIQRFKLRHRIKEKQNELQENEIVHSTSFRESISDNQPDLVNELNLSHREVYIESDFDSSIESTSNSDILSESNPIADDVSFLDRCQIRFGGTFSEIEVQDVGKFSFILMILFFLIPYHIIYFQMESTYMYQGMRMRVGTGSSVYQFNVPASWLIVIDIILLMFLLPLLVKVIYPWLGRRQIYFRQSSKMALGFLFVLLSVLIAGCVEIQRLYIEWINNEVIVQIIDNANFNASNMSIWYQVPQFVFMGFSEALAVVSGLELACAHVSSSMQGLVNGLFWFSAGLGGFLGTGILYVFEQLPLKGYSKCNENNLSCGLYIYFFILAGIIFVSLVLFLLFLLKYRKLENIEQDDLTISRLGI